MSENRKSDPGPGSSNVRNEGGSRDASIPCVNIMSSETPICRICFRGESSEILVSPCDCKGSINNIHPGCLEQWLEIKNTDSCDLCHYKFDLAKTRKSCFEYFKDPSTLNDRRKIFFFVICLSLSTPFVTLFIINCMENAFYSAEVKHREWDAAALSALATALAAAQIALIVFAAKFTYTSIALWRSCHFSVTLLYKNHNPSRSALPIGNTGINFIESSSSNSSASSSSPDDQLLPLIPKDKRNAGTYSSTSTLSC